MAKSARSNRMKSLRTVRRQHMPTWQAEADAKRMAALAACVAAEPLPVVDRAADRMLAEAEERGRSGNTSAPAVVSMAVDVEKPQPKGRRKNGVTKVTGKKPKKQVSVLWGKNQFHKKARKGSKVKK